MLNIDIIDTGLIRVIMVLWAITTSYHQRFMTSFMTFQDSKLNTMPSLTVLRGWHASMESVSPLYASMPSAASS